jgi:hypothetical protein
VKVGYSAMAYQWRASSDRTKDPAPWRVAADFYGVDTYSGGAGAVDAAGYRDSAREAGQEVRLVHRLLIAGHQLNGREGGFHSRLVLGTLRTHTRHEPGSISVRPYLDACSRTGDERPVLPDSGHEVRR